jgi:hypothetical protein
MAGALVLPREGMEIAVPPTNPHSTLGERTTHSRWPARASANRTCGFSGIGLSGKRFNADLFRRLRGWRYRIRNITPAMRDFRVKLSTTAITRRAPKLDYAKARQRWWIHVECDSNNDLCILEKALSGSEIRLVELGDKFYVEYPRIPDTAHMGEAYRLAETIIAKLNGSIRVLHQHFNGARIESSRMPRRAATEKEASFGEDMCEGMKLVVAHRRGEIELEQVWPKPIDVKAIRKQVKMSQAQF